jgi:hypothetical protein
LQGDLQEEENNSSPVHLGELQKALDPSDHFSGIICQAVSLAKSHISKALLSEFNKVLEMLDIDRI